METLLEAIDAPKGMWVIAHNIANQMGYEYALETVRAWAGKESNRNAAS
jgi:hypothetical protein